jgi:hypothetical protein
MKKIYVLLAVALVAISCDSLKITRSAGEGVISFKINSAKFALMQKRLVKASSLLQLDTNSFILSVYTTGGAKVYEGKYGERPSEMVVGEGSYDIKIRSSNFSVPEFDKPLFGEDQTVDISADKITRVEFSCRQLNAGVKLTFAQSFINQFRGSGVKLVDDYGSLLYTYQESRHAYLLPGLMKIVCSRNGADTVLMERELIAAQMLSCNLSYSLAGGNLSSSFKIEIDTSRIWITDNFNAGLKIPAGAYTVINAKQHVGEKNIMVFGYIIGGDVTANTIRIGPPFSSKTNIVVAGGKNERQRANCFAVELPSGPIRDAINLVDNPDLIGSAIVVTGEIVSNYYGYIGVKGTKAYSLLK